MVGWSFVFITCHERVVLFVVGVGAKYQVCRLCVLGAVERLFY